MNSSNPGPFTSKGRAILKELGNILSPNNSVESLTKKILSATTILNVSLPAIFKDYKQKYLTVFGVTPVEIPQIMKMDSILQKGLNNKKAMANEEEAKRKAAANEEEAKRKAAANEEAKRKAMANEEEAKRKAVANEEMRIANQAKRKAMANEEMRIANQARKAAANQKSKLDKLAKNIRNAVGNNTPPATGFLKAIQNRKAGLRPVVPNTRQTGTISANLLKNRITGLRRINQGNHPNQKPVVPNVKSQIQQRRSNMRLNNNNN